MEGLWWCFEVGKVQRRCCERDVTMELRWFFDGSSMYLRRIYALFAQPSSRNPGVLAPLHLGAFALVQLRFSGSVDRLEVEQLSAVGGQVEVEALDLQVISGALIAFLAQQIFHGPVVRGQMLEAEQRVTLAAMRREIHGHQVELRRLLLPLHDDKVLRGRIARPGGARLAELTPPLPHRRARERQEELLIAVRYLVVAGFRRAARQLNGNLEARPGELAVMQEAH